VNFEPEPAVAVSKRRIFLPLPDFQGLHTDGDKPRGLACPHIYFRNFFPRLAERHRFFSQPLPLNMCEMERLGKEVVVCVAGEGLRFQ